MSISVTFNSTHHVLLSSEFFLARRPIVDRTLQPVAHELLFCAPQQASEADADAKPAGASVIFDVCEYGLTRVLGDLHGLLYLDASALMSNIFDFLPADRVVFELPPLQDAASRERLAQLARAGFRFALVATRDDETARAMLPLVMGVRLDIRGRTGDELEPVCNAFRSAGKRLLAEGVDTPALMRECLDLGFDFFQGYHFALPQIDPTRGLAATELAIMEVMALIASDADSAEIEHRMKSDVTLGLKLLRMANAPAFGHRRIDSLRQALMVIGRDQLQRWLQLMLYADAAEDGRPVLPLLALAAARGRLMELAAQKLRPGNRGIADSAFTVGIMSLMDTLFSMPMDEILRQMPVGDEVVAALRAREGYLGKLLVLAESTEWAAPSAATLRLLLADLKLSFDVLYGLQLAAWEWSDQVVQHARSR